MPSTTKKIEYKGGFILRIENKRHVFVVHPALMWINKRFLNIKDAKLAIDEGFSVPTWLHERGKKHPESMGKFNS